MKIIVLDSKRKALHRAINTSIVSAGSLLFLGFILSYFNSSTLTSIGVFLLLLSILPILIGLNFSIALAIKDKHYIDFDEHKETLLVLNIKEYDFKIGDKMYMGYSGNYLVQENPRVRYEITSDEVEGLLADKNIASWHKSFELTDKKMLDSSPKRVFNDIMSGP